MCVSVVSGAAAGRSESREHVRAKLLFGHRQLAVYRPPVLRDLMRVVTRIHNNFIMTRSLYSLRNRLTAT